MKVNEINQAYATKFDTEIQSYIDHHNIEMLPHLEYLRRYGYFITFIFKRELKLAFSDGQDRDNPQFKNFDLIYNLACRFLLGRHYGKQMEMQPLVIAALDANGTKVSNRLEEVENVHLHTIWVFPPDFDNTFMKFIDGVRSLKKLEKTDIRRVDVRMIGSFEKSDNRPSRLSSYLAKFLGQNAERLLVLNDDWRVYPLDYSSQRRRKQPAEAGEIQQPRLANTGTKSSFARTHVGPAYTRVTVERKKKWPRLTPPEVPVTTSDNVSLEQFLVDHEDMAGLPQGNPSCEEGYWDALIRGHEELKDWELVGSWQVGNPSVKSDSAAPLDGVHELAA